MTKNKFNQKGKIMVASWVKESRAKAYTRNSKMIVVLEIANAQVASFVMLKDNTSCFEIEEEINVVFSAFA